MRRAAALLAALLLAAGCVPAESGPTARCGDSKVDDREECDLGARNGASDARCLQDCTLPRCGDGLVQEWRRETCDEALPEGASSATCTSLCVPPSCGDGLVSAGEGCDDGLRNDDATGACSSRCVLRARCGDGTLDVAEECDDGPRNHDAFGACTTTCLRARCGDGVVQADECCDGEIGCDARTCRWSDCGACAVAADEDSSLVLLADGRLFGFGANRTSQTGDPAVSLGQSEDEREVTTPRELFPSLRFQSVAQGWRGGAGILAETRALVAWGHDGYGLLGQGRIWPGEAPAPVGAYVVDDTHAYAWITRGGNAAIAGRVDGTVVGWGSRANGQLPGEIPAEEITQACWWAPCVPSVVPLFVGTELEGARFVEVDIGTFHALGLREDGTVWGWGRGREGQLGPRGGELVPGCVDAAGEPIDFRSYNLPPNAPASPPVRIEGGWARPTRVIAGRFSSFVIDERGQVWGFGANCVGELGSSIGAVDALTEPTRLVLSLDVPLAGLERAPVAARAVATGYVHTMVLDARGWAVGFGWNGEGQIASAFDDRFVTPLTVDPLPGSVALALAAGARHDLVIDRGGRVFVFGEGARSARGGATGRDWAQVHLCGDPP